jgi:RHS repeat-associated protein
MYRPNPVSPFLVVSFVALFVLISFASSVSAQCGNPGYPSSPPSAPSLTVAAGPSYNQVTYTVSGVPLFDAAEIWVKNLHNNNYYHLTNLSDGTSYTHNGRPHHTEVFAFARLSNVCGNSDSGVDSDTTFNIGYPTFTVTPGPLWAKITIDSEWIEPEAYSHIWVSTNTTSWTLYTYFSDGPPQTMNITPNKIYYLYAQVEVNSTENHNSPIQMIAMFTDQNNGDQSCSGDAKWFQAPATVGRPVNVTTGNMYLAETDYRLPGKGVPIDLTRSYNSLNPASGLFGVGWTTQYDEVLTTTSTHTVRIGAPDGRGMYFGRTNTSDPYVSASPKLKAQVVANVDGTYTLTYRDGRIHHFNSSGKLAWLKDRNGNQTTVNYDGYGAITGVTDAASRTMSFTLNAYGRVTSVSDSTGTIADYEYTSSSSPYLKTVTYPDGSEYNFAYTYNSALERYVISSVKDALDNILESHSYDGSGRATTSIVQGGVEEYTLNYTEDGYTEVTDALDRVTKYWYSPTTGYSVVTKVEGLCGCGGGGTEATQYFYDHNLNVTKKTDALSNDTTYTYNSDGDLTSITDTLGTQSFTYNAFGEVLTHTDRMSGVTTNTYDTDGNLLTTTDPLSKTTTLTYTGDGQIESVTDARSKTTDFTYDSNGLLTQVTDANSNDTDIAYNARGLVTSVTNALSQTTEYEYDSNNRLNKVIYPDTNEVNIEYDLAGRKTSVTDELNHETTYAYDGAYRLTGITDALSHTTIFDYDLMSNLISQTDALGNETSFEYDDFDRVKKVIHPVPSPSATPMEETYAYNKLGKVTSHTDTAGHTTTYTYDNAKRLTKITDALSNDTEFTYNARSQTTKVKDELAQEYTFTYDALGRVLTQTRNGTTITFTYDNVGNRATRTDYNGNVSTYTYDDLNRLTAIAYTGATGENASYTYDDLSRILTAVNAAGTVTFTYNNRGWLATEEDVFGHDLEYTYDAAGNRTGLELDNTAHTAYAYDDANRLTTLTDEASNDFTFAYDNANKLISKTLPNGIVTTYEYDGMSRLKRLKDVYSATSLFDRQYSYNSANQISQITDLSNTRVFTYDNINQLTGVSVGGTPTESYTYDAVGNRTASHLSGSYTTSSFNRLTATSTATIGYNSNGSMTSKALSGTTWAYTWNRENQLASASDGTNSVSYLYDALGRRVQRTQGGTTSKYSYDGNDVVLDDVNSTLTKYQNGLGIDNKLKQVSGGTSKYFLADYLGSTNGLANSSGAVIDSTGYDSFGNATNGSFSSRYQFTGRELDSLTGLDHYRARSYDPSVGRFISQDPIGFEGGDVNLYGYVKNSPVNYTDPDGTQIRSDSRWEPYSPDENRQRVQSVASMSPTRTPNNCACQSSVGPWDGSLPFFMNPGSAYLPFMYPDARSLRVEGHNLYPGPTNSAKRHQWASEQLARRYGVQNARLYGQLNEVQGLLWQDLPDLPARSLGIRPWAFQADDLLDNEIGFDKARQACHQGLGFFN